MLRALLIDSFDRLRGLQYGFGLLGGDCQLQRATARAIDRTIGQLPFQTMNEHGIVRQNASISYSC
jgi:hypothetical protein